MDDKEVGKLWRRVHDDCLTLDACQNHGDMVRLIRKLVEERAKLLGWELDCGYRAKLLGWELDCGYEEANTLNALADFGIDPKEWEK